MVAGSSELKTFRPNYKTIDIEKFDELVDKGLNCKEIAKEMNISQNCFGIKFKKHFGIYPSVYVAKKRNKYRSK